MRRRVIAPLTATIGAAALTLGAGAAALAANGHLYKGRTSQHKPVALTVVGKRVEGFVIQFDGSCTNGAKSAGNSAYGFVPPPPPLVTLDARDRFSFHDKTALTLTRNKRFRSTYAVRGTGQVKGATASGSFSAVITFYTLKGKVAERCPTATVHFTAH